MYFYTLWIQRRWCKDCSQSELTELTLLLCNCFSVKTIIFCINFVAQKVTDFFFFSFAPSTPIRYKIVLLLRSAPPVRPLPASSCESANTLRFIMPPSGWLCHCSPLVVKCFSLVRWELLCCIQQQGYFVLMFWWCVQGPWRVKVIKAKMFTYVFFSLSLMTLMTVFIHYGPSCSIYGHKYMAWLIPNNCRWRHSAAVMAFSLMIIWKSSGAAASLRVCNCFIWPWIEVCLRQLV